LNNPQSASRALKIAKMWTELPVEHLEVALKALEPELQRDHEYQVMLLQHEKDLRAYTDQQLIQRRKHALYMSGLWAGFLIAIGMLAAAVFVATVNQQTWLATLLVGPSLLALAKLFVIRKSDSDDASRVLSAQKRETYAEPDVANS